MMKYFILFTNNTIRYILNNCDNISGVTNYCTIIFWINSFENQRKTLWEFKFDDNIINKSNNCNNILGETNHCTIILSINSFENQKNAS